MSEHQKAIDALVKFMYQHPTVPVTGEPWFTSFEAGYRQGTKDGARCGVCDGNGSVNIKGSGHCRCPACAPFAHYRSICGEPLCGHDDLRAKQYLSDTWSDVTCADCFQVQIGRVQDDDGI
jgi:hypothetical protein